MSSGAIILPAVNRGTLRTVSQSFSGIFAYASRNNVYFIDTKTIPPTFLDSLYLQDIHKSKIVALAFSKHDGSDILATCCEDGELKIWDIVKKSCLQKIETKETNVLEWVYGSPDTLVFSSEGRFLVKYSVKRNTQIKIRTASEFNISVISASEKNSEYIAAGHYNGVISVINVVQEKLISKLKAHHAEITDLYWNLDSPDMLLSLSSDLSVRTWKLGENSPLNTYYSPHTKFKNDDKKSPRLLGLFHPTKLDVVICANTKGEVGEITMKSENSKFVSYAMRNMENNLRYPIAIFLSSCKEFLYCWDSFKVTKIDITKKELVTNFPFVMGFVYDMSISRVNPNLLSISNGDGILRVYDGCAQSNRLNVTSIYIYFRTKIMTAAWHPRSENILAYATDEGRVGIVDTFRKKSIYCFETHHTGAVYSLTWGTCAKAPNTESDDPFYLYSCGGGTIYINKENNFKTKALDFDTLTEKPVEYHDSNHSYSEACWNFDYTLFCVGSYKGFVELYDSALNFLGRLIVPMKSVESLRWHPETTYMSPAGSPLKSWLACSGSENEIYIFDSAMISTATKPEVYMFRPIKKLVGHNKRIVSLSWSEHCDGFLASASKDGSAMVWNVVTQTCIATYLSHFDVVLSIQWSAIDKDVIYSGGQGGSVRAWKISEQTPKPAPDKAPIRKKLKRPKRMENKSSNDTTETENLSREDSKKSSIPSDDSRNSSKVQPVVNGNSSSKEVLFGKKSVLLPTHNFEEASFNGEEIENCKRLAEILSGKHKKTPSLDFSFDSLKKNVLSDDAVLKFGLYTDQPTAQRMLDLQSDKFLSNDNLAAACDIALFSGNIKQVLMEAAEKKKLTVSLVSFAPAVSHSFWVEMCEKFATQLIDMQSYFKAAQYYLICGNIHAAVDLLANRGNLVDAVALAKARLPETDKTISNLLIMLKKKYEMSKNTAGVIQCELALNEPLKAAKMLATTSDPHAVRAAAFICQQFELNMQATEYLFLFLETCLVKYNYKAFQAYAEEESFLQSYEALVCVHQEFHDQVRYLRRRDGLSLSTVFYSEDDLSLVKFWCGVVDKDVNQPFIGVLNSIMQSRNILSEKKCPVKDILKALKILEERRKSLEISSEAHIPVSIFLTEYIILSQRKEDFANKVLLNIFQASHNISSLPRILCLLFFPINIYWNEGSKSFNCEILSSVNLNTDNNFMSYSHICQSIADKIQSFKLVAKESLFTKEDLQNNLLGTTSEIKQVLLSKTTDVLLLLYFVANLTNELHKIIKKDEQVFDCCLENILHETSQNSEAKSVVSDTRLIKSIVNDISKSHNCFDEITIDNLNRETDKDVSTNFIEEDNVAETNDKTAAGDLVVIETLCHKNETHNTKENEEVLTLKSEETVSVTENSRNITEPNVFDNVDFQENNLKNLAGCQDLVLSENGIIDVSVADNNDVQGITEENVNKNDFVDLHDLQLQELIQSVIREADLKAQAIMEQNTEASDAVVKNDCISEVNVTSNGNSSSGPDEDTKSPNCAVNTSSEYDVTKSTLAEENQHESCLTSTDLFCSIISFISQTACKDEFALLYYLKERLNYLNNMMSATVLSEMSKEFSKNNKGRANKNRKRKEKPKDLLHSPSAEQSFTSENKIADLAPPVEKTTCDDVSENKRADQVISETKSDDSQTGDSSISENKNVHPTSSTEISSISENNNENENTDIEITLQDNGANEELLSENETLTDVNDDAISIVSSDSNSNVVQSSEINNFLQNDAVIEEEKDKLVTNCNEDGDKDVTSDISADMNHASVASSENAKGSEGESPKIIRSTELLKQEHKVISDALALLEENVECCIYPNPFDILSKLSETISHVICKSECQAVQNKLHAFLHDIIIDWSEKFCVGENKYVCKICNAVD